MSWPVQSLSVAAHDSDPHAPAHCNGHAHAHGDDFGRSGYYHNANACSNRNGDSHSNSNSNADEHADGHLTANRHADAVANAIQDTHGDGKQVKESDPV